MGSVGVLIGLGAMFGKLLADSGGADQIVDTLVARSNPKSLPWTMALVGAIIGLPMFFEIGLVLLIPVVILVARRSGLPLMRIAIPTLAGLSAMHGLVPPHPGPADRGRERWGPTSGITLGFGVLVAIPDRDRRRAAVQHVRRPVGAGGGAGSVRDRRRPAGTSAEREQLLQTKARPDLRGGAVRHPAAGHPDAGQGDRRRGGGGLQELRQAGRSTSSATPRSRCCWR